MIEAVRRDLERGLKKSRDRSHGLTPKQVLRSLILKGSRIGIFRELRDGSLTLHAASVHGFLLPAGAEHVCFQTVPLTDCSEDAAGRQ